MIDNWRRKQRDIPSRAEAIRRLASMALGAEPILRDILKMIESLPANAELAEHEATIRRLVEKGLER